MRSGVEERKTARTLEIAGLSDVGLARRANQDAFRIDEALHLAVVCDGMGGHAAGEVASEVAVETFLDVVRREIEAVRSADGERSRRALCRAAAAANRAVRARADYDTRYRGMGTTLVAALLDGNDLAIANVGDSRAYLVRNGKARQVTRDHSLVAERTRLGLMTPDEAERSPLQSAITRAIGLDEDVRADLFTETVEDGDVLLLCSDGLIRHVHDEEIAAMTGTASRTLAEMCADLIALANARGGTDNVTCVLMRCALAG